MKILLGYEIGTGNEVYIDPDHLLETGLTQQSGKTTALNALITRSGRRAITFRTKRGEIDWTVAKQLQPFYKEPKRRGNLIDWMYVKDLLSAAMEKPLEFEEAWIIRSCEGASTLREVYENIKVLQGESTRGIDQNQYLKLEKYFEIILPQLEARTWASTLPLVKGVNLMDLEKLSFEMQCLVIERTIDYVLKNMKDVIVVLPEARKFIPLAAKTPVTNTAIKMAAEGAVLDLDLWVDSQTYSSINNEVRKQCGTQIHGVQMDNNEAKTVSDLLDKKWKPRKIRGLKLGHFFVKTKDKRYLHVYVLPAGIPEEEGKGVAMGTIPVEAVKNTLESFKPDPKFVKVPEWEEETEVELHMVVDPKELDGLQKTVEELENKSRGLEAELQEIEHRLEGVVARNKQLEADKEELTKEIDRWKGQVENLNEELGPYRALQMLLRQFIGPGISLEEYEEHIKTVVDKALLDLPKARRHRPATAEDTGIAWIDIWMPKVGPAEKKILTFMASRFPMKMTKSEIAIGCGLTARGGYFNGAFNKLRKNHLVIEVGKGNFKLAENPP